VEKYKKQNFERDHGQDTFIQFSSLDSRSALELRLLLARSLGLDPGTSGRDILQVVRDRGMTVECVSADSEAFDFGLLLTGLGLRPSEKLYLNWYRFDRIDVVYTKDMIASFSDIWYPSVDDLDIFDVSASWIISITHYGAVQFLKMNNE
jgi:hypothetical protein